MNLLILTQKVDKNDDILGFFHGWLLEFAKNYEKITVICLYEGEHNLPNNVKVLSLGKEKGVSRLKYILDFYKYIWKERNNYDQVFVHMNQIYVILGGLFWRLRGKKVGLWYAHGSVPFGLRFAEKISNYIFTSTKSGFRLNSKKLKIIGQGIDTNLFKPQNSIEEKEIFEIISVGRISPVKDYETTIKAIEILNKKGKKIRLKIIGGLGLSSQQNYLNKLKKMVSEKSLDNIIEFCGGVPSKDILGYLQKSDLYINTSHTGSLDKTVLEAMSCGLPVLTCNEALKEVLGEYKEKLMFSKKDPEEFSNKIEDIMKMDISGRIILGQKLREIVIKDHNLENFIKKIVEVFK